MSQAPPFGSASSFGPIAASTRPSARKRANVVTDVACSRANEAETLELMFNVTSTANEVKTLQEAFAIALEGFTFSFPRAAPDANTSDSQVSA